MFTEHHLSVIKFVNFDDAGSVFCIEKTFHFNVINSHFSKMFGVFSQYLNVAIIWANLINSKPELIWKIVLFSVSLVE